MIASVLRAAVRRGALVVLSTVAVALFLGSVATLAQPVRYSAAAQAYVSVTSGSTGTDLVQGASFSQDAVKSYADLARSALVLDDVIQELGSDATVADLAGRISVSSPVDTSVLLITASAPTADSAADLANAVSDGLARTVRTLTPEAGTGSSSGVLVTRIEDATAPASPVRPDLPLTLGIAAVLGLLAGILAARLRTGLDTRVRDASDLEAVVAVPVLGEIVRASEALDARISSPSGAQDERMESLRVLRTNLQFLDPSGSARSFLLTSASAGAGTTSAVADLAVLMAATGRRTVVVDADLRHPALAARFEFEGTLLGLTDVILGRLPLEGALLVSPGTAVTVLAAGSMPPNASDLLQSTAMRRVLHQLSAEFEVVLIDGPPAGARTDAPIVAGWADATILLAEHGRTTVRQLRAAAVDLRQADARVLGTVLLNAARRTDDMHATAPR